MTIYYTWKIELRYVMTFCSGINERFNKDKLSALLRGTLRCSKLHLKWWLFVCLHYRVVNVTYKFRSTIRKVSLFRVKFISLNTSTSSGHVTCKLLVKLFNDNYRINNVIYFYFEYMTFRKSTDACTRIHGHPCTQDYLTMTRVHKILYLFIISRNTLLGEKWGTKYLAISARPKRTGNFSRKLDCGISALDSLYLGSRRSLS